MRDDDEYVRERAADDQIKRELEEIRRTHPDFQKYLEEEGSAAVKEFCAKVQENAEAALFFCAREPGEYDYQELRKLQQFGIVMLTGAALGMFEPPGPQSAPRSEDEIEFTREELRLMLRNLSLRVKSTSDFLYRDPAEYSPEELQELVEMGFMAILAIHLGVLR